MPLNKDKKTRTLILSFLIPRSVISSTPAADRGAVKNDKGLKEKSGKNARRKTGWTADVEEEVLRGPSAFSNLAFPVFSF